MGWKDFFRKAGQVTQVALPVVAPQTTALQAALAVVSVAVEDGRVSEAELELLNSLLRPHGLEVVRKS